MENKYGNEINSTGSFMGELSLTQSEDDFLDVPKVEKTFKKHRPSANGNVSFADSKHNRSTKNAEKRRSQRKSNGLAVGDNEKIVATTKVSIPQGEGPIKATSTIEAIPQFYERDNDKQRKASPERHNENVNPTFSPSRRSMKLKDDIPMPAAPTAPTLQEINSNQKTATLLSSRQHSFASKTFLRSDTCSHCLKR